MTKIGSRSRLLSLVLLVIGSEMPAKAKATAGATVWPAGDLKWVDAPNAPRGVKQVVLWGDPTAGKFGVLQKFPAGFSAPCTRTRRSCAWSSSRGR